MLGNMSFVKLVANSLIRAWTFCGLAIRQALTLGLHVRNEAKDISDVEKEHRVRLWWSLYSLECSLNELTGRPTCISDRDISTPLPVNVEIDIMEPLASLYVSDDQDMSTTSQGAESSKSKEGTVTKP